MTQTGSADTEPSKRDGSALAGPDLRATAVGSASAQLVKNSCHASEAELRATLQETAAKIGRQVIPIPLHAYLPWPPKWL